MLKRECMGGLSDVKLDNWARNVKKAERLANVAKRGEHREFGELEHAASLRAIARAVIMQGQYAQ